MAILFASARALAHDDIGFLRGTATNVFYFH
jgi:hypothetical protein